MTDDATPLLTHARALELAATRVHTMMRRPTRDESGAVTNIAGTLDGLHDVETELDNVRRELVTLMRRDGCDWPLIGQLLDMPAADAEARYS